MMRRYPVLLLIPIIWVGFGLRLHLIGAVPLRGDEAFSAQYWSDLPLSESISEIAPLDPHPPLVYVLFRFWRLVLGTIDSPTALRLLGVLGNILGIPAMYVMGRRLSSSAAVGIVTGLLWAVHAYEIWHSQDFRNYAIWAGMSATALALGLKLIDKPQRRNWVLYGLAAATSAFLFYSELFLMTALAAIAILRKRADWRFLFRFLALQAGIVAAVLLTLSGIAIHPDRLGRVPGKCRAILCAGLSYSIDSDAGCW